MGDQRLDWEADTGDHVFPREQKSSWLEEDRRHLDPRHEELVLRVIRSKERKAS